MPGAPIVSTTYKRPIEAAFLFCVRIVCEREKLGASGGNFERVSHSEYCENIPLNTIFDLTYLLTFLAYLYLCVRLRILRILRIGPAQKKEEPRLSRAPGRSTAYPGKV
jgi:hypothetical protein